MKRIILASGSPRRKALLQQIGLAFETEKSNIEEKLNPRLKPRGNAEQLSLQKAIAVSENYNSRFTPDTHLVINGKGIRRKRNKHDEAIIIAADTFVVFNGEIIGKPFNKNDARRILRKLSGNVHSVITGFTIFDTSTGKIVTKSAETKVYFKKLSNKDIDKYIATGEPLDKAGAYAMQGKGGMFVEKIIGEPFNVVGLPLQAMLGELKRFGVSII